MEHPIQPITPPCSFPTTAQLLPTMCQPQFGRVRFLENRDTCVWCQQQQQQKREFWPPERQVLHLCYLLLRQSTFIRHTHPTISNHPTTLDKPTYCCCCPWVTQNYHFWCLFGQTFKNDLYKSPDSKTATICIPTPPPTSMVPSSSCICLVQWTTIIVN